MATQAVRTLLEEFQALQADIERISVVARGVIKQSDWPEDERDEMQRSIANLEVRISGITYGLMIKVGLVPHSNTD